MRAFELSEQEMSEQLFNRLILGSLVAATIILAGLIGAAGWLLIRAGEYTESVAHTYEVEAKIFQFRTAFERAEAARRAFLLSGREMYHASYEAAAPRLEPALEEVSRLTVDNPRQQSNIARLRPAIREKIGLMEESIGARRSGGVPAATAAFERPREQALVNEIRGASEAMGAEERRLLALRSARQTSAVRGLLVVTIPAGLLLALLAGGSTFIMRRFARDLVRSRTALARLNAGLEDAVRERTADLVRANAEIQRFAYIVSHDLRAPLVNVMGFTSELEVASKPLADLVQAVEAEAPHLLTPGAKAAVETDLPESLGFIRTSTQKMDRLISAILKLSREGRRTLTPEPLAMAAMVEGIARSLHSQIEARGVDFAVEGSLPDIVGDRLAVEQVFSNLIENALKYLKPGRPGRVRVRGRTSGDQAIFEVEDNGRGIDPKDQERIFELFRRAGAQDQPGEGIGLAHVRALVHRFGGTIACDSALDRGATFRLCLPRVLTREGLD